MIKKLAWNTFKNTGNINTFLELVEVENVEKNLQNMNNSIDNKNFNVDTNTQSKNKNQL